MSAEDRAALLDARVAALKAGLKLTPDQEKNWAPLEAAIREQAKERAKRFAAWREKRESQDEHHDLIERLQMRSQWMTQRAANIEKLIAAAKPLYNSSTTDRSAASPNSCALQAAAIVSTGVTRADCGAPRPDLCKPEILVNICAFFLRPSSAGVEGMNQNAISSSRRVGTGRARVPGDPALRQILPRTSE